MGDKTCHSTHAWLFTCIYGTGKQLISWILSIRKQTAWIQGNVDPFWIQSPTDKGPTSYLFIVQSPRDRGWGFSARHCKGLGSCGIVSSTVGLADRHCVKLATMRLHAVSFCQKYSPLKLIFLITCIDIRIWTNLLDLRLLAMRSNREVF